MRGAPHGCRAGVIGCDRRTSAGLGARCAHEPRRGSLRPTGSAFAPPSTADPSTLLVYVMDIYDPESWAYLPSVSAVLSAACSLVDVEVVQSGRFAAGSPAACLIALLASRGEQVFEFDGPGATVDRLVDQFRTVLTRP